MRAVRAVAALGCLLAAAAVGLDGPVLAAPARDPAAAATSPAPDGWRSFRSQAGRFSVDLPAPPETHTSSQMTLGGRIESAVYRVETGGVELRVEHHEVPSLARLFLDDEALLERAERDFLADEEAADVQARSARIQGHAARELRYRVRGRETVGRAWFLLVGSRLYLLAGLRADSTGSDGFDRFFGSFRVEEAPAS